MKCVALAAIFAVGLACAANAATVEVLSGSVSVNKGKGYQQVSGIFEVNPGDRVLVEAAGNANIVYSDGCFIKVGDALKRATLVIPEPAGCAVGVQATTVVTGLVIAGAVVGGVLLATNASDKSKPASP